MSKSLKLIISISVFAATILWEIFEATHPEIRNANPFRDSYFSGYVFLLAIIQAISLVTIVRVVFEDRINTDKLDGYGCLGLILLWLSYLGGIFGVLYVCMQVYLSIMHWGYDMEKKNSYIKLGYVVDKKHHAGRRRTPSSHMIYAKVDSKNTVSAEVDRNDYNDINPGDTVIVRVTDAGGLFVLECNPTSEIIAQYKIPVRIQDGKRIDTTPKDMYSDEVRNKALQQSHTEIGRVYEIYNLDSRHFVRVGTDVEHTTIHEFIESDRLYAKAFKRLQVGNEVVIRVSDEKPEINEVLIWMPDKENLKKYKDKTPYTVPQFASKFERGMNLRPNDVQTALQESHLQMGKVYDKYRDDNVGGYLEIGTDGSFIKAYKYNLCDSGQMKMFSMKQIDDKVIMRVSDKYPRVMTLYSMNPNEEELNLLSETSSLSFEDVDKRIKEKKKKTEFFSEAAYEKRKSEKEREGLIRYYTNSHKQTGYIWRIDEQENAIAIDIGVTEDDICTHYLTTSYELQYFKNMRMKVGYAVILQVSDDYPNRNRVLNWNPSRYEIETYRTPVKMETK